MADYTTTANLKTYIGTAEATDDALLATLITRASARIDTYCRRTFTGRTETRKFDAVNDVDRGVLYLDDDLLSITTVTNGDSTAVTSGQYVLLPANETPKYAIRLKASSGVSWTYQNDPEEAISIAGSWGFANSAPDDVAHACIRLAAWYYAQRDAPFETQGFPELNAVSVPADVPPDVRVILDQYVRHGVGGVE